MISSSPYPIVKTRANTITNNNKDATTPIIPGQRVSETPSTLQNFYNKTKIGSQLVKNYRSTIDNPELEEPIVDTLTQFDLQNTSIPSSIKS